MDVCESYVTLGTEMNVHLKTFNQSFFVSYANAILVIGTKIMILELFNHPTNSQQFG